MGKLIKNIKFKLKKILSKPQKQVPTSKNFREKVDNYFKKPVIIVNLKPRSIEENYRNEVMEERERFGEIASRESHRRFLENEKKWLEEGEIFEYEGFLPVIGHEYGREEWVNEMKFKRQQGKEIKITNKTLDVLMSSDKSNLTGEEKTLRVLIMKNPDTKINEPEDILDEIPFFEIEDWIKNIK